MKLTKVHDSKAMVHEPNVHALPFQQLHAKLFYAQRNLYLTGFTLAVAVILYRYLKTYWTNIELCEEHTRLEKSSSERKSMTAKQFEDLEYAKAELTLLRSKMADSEAALKQARAQQKEFDRLIDRCNELESRLSDEKSKDK